MFDAEYLPNFTVPLITLQTACNPH